MQMNLPHVITCAERPRVERGLHTFLSPEPRFNCQYEVFEDVLNWSNFQVASDGTDSDDPEQPSVQAQASKIDLCHAQAGSTQRDEVVL